MRRTATLLASCALLATLPVAAVTPAPCTTCDVTVIVPAGCGSGIHVAPDPLLVANGAKITWTIRSSTAWKFENDGIKIHNGAAAFKSEGKGGGTTFTATRVTGTPGIYKYDITLTTELGNPAKACKHDPTIINQ
jgi:hypothetical protein